MVIFNVVKTRRDVGYHLTERMTVLLLQYADDTCLVVNSPSAAQELLHIVKRWLCWSGMKTKVLKCHSLALKASVGRLVDPHLSIDGQKISLFPWLDLPSPT